MAAPVLTEPPAPIPYATPQPARRAGRRVLAIAILLVIVCGGALLLVGGLFFSRRPTVVPLPRSVNGSAPAIGTTNASRQGDVLEETGPTTTP